MSFYTTDEQFYVLLRQYVLNDALQNISSKRSPLLIHFSVHSCNIMMQNMTDQHVHFAKQLYIPTIIYI